MRRLGEGEGDAEAGAPGGGTGRPEGRLALVREGLVVVPAEDEGLQKHPAGEAGGGQGDLEQAVDCYGKLNSESNLCEDKSGDL